MSKLRPIKFISKKTADGKYYYSIESSNGNNLNPADPQTEKKNVEKTVSSLILHIKAGAYEIIDETEIKKI